MVKYGTDKYKIKSRDCAIKCTVHSTSNRYVFTTRGECP